MDKDIKEYFKTTSTEIILMITLFIISLMLLIQNSSTILNNIGFIELCLDVFIFFAWLNGIHKIQTDKDIQKFLKFLRELDRSDEEIKKYLKEEVLEWN